MNFQIPLDLPLQVTIDKIERKSVTMSSGTLNSILCNPQGPYLTQNTKPNVNIDYGSGVLLTNPN